MHLKIKRAEKHNSPAGPTGFYKGHSCFRPDLSEGQSTHCTLGRAGAVPAVFHLVPWGKKYLEPVFAFCFSIWPLGHPEAMLEPRPGIYPDLTQAMLPGSHFLPFLDLKKNLFAHLWRVSHQLHIIHFCFCRRGVNAEVGPG